MEDAQIPAGSKLEAFRLKNPQFSNLSDLEVADSLYTKFYATQLSPEEFGGRLGVSDYANYRTSQRNKALGRTALELGLSVAAPTAIPGRLMARGALGLAERGLAAGVGEAGGSLASETFDPSKDPLRRAGIAGVTGVVGEGIGSAGAAALKKVLSPNAASLRPGAEEAISAVTPEGGVITPGVAVENRAVGLAENIAAESFTGGGRIARTYGKATDILQKQLDDFVGRFYQNGSKVEVGELIQQAVEDRLGAFTAAARSKYAKVDEMTEGATVNISNLKAEAQALQLQLAAGLPSAAPGAKSILENIVSKPDTISFADAATLRSDLLSIARGGTDLIPGKAKGVGKKLSGEMDRAMQTGMQGAPPEALRAWREANEFWKQGSKEFNSQLLKTLARRDPEMVFQAAIRPGRPNTIAETRRIVGAGSEEWKAIQGQWLYDTMRNATDENGVVSGNKLLSSMKKFGDDALKELFPAGDHRASLQMIAKSMRLIEEGTQTSGLRMMVQLTQGGAVAGVVLTGGDPASMGTAAFVFLTPYAISRIITNQTAARWLSTGLRAPYGTDVAMRAIGQLSSWMAREKILEGRPESGK